MPQEARNSTAPTRDAKIAALLLHPGASPAGRCLVHNPVVEAATRTAWVVEQARALGFDLCGVARAEDFAELDHLPEWLAREYAGEMSYLHDARRRSPERVLEGARSIIVCALNYNTALPYSTHSPVSSSGAEAPEEESEGRFPAAGLKPRPSRAAASREPHGWISRYAWGDDYHEVLGEKLEALIAALRNRFREPFAARAYVDTGPVVERVAAKYAGLGWLAKNTCLINSQFGSWLFLGVILTTLDLAPSLGPAEAPPPDLCGNCRLCLEACPTGAIVEPYVLDARRCISYLTIELRGPIPVEFREAMGRHVFGCDICQDVCPWNRQAPVSSLPSFLPRTLPMQEAQRTERAEPVGARQLSRAESRDAVPLQTAEKAPVSDQNSLFAPSLEWLASLSEEDFREAFRSSAVKRAKWHGLVRNACVALANSGVRPGTPAHARIAAQLERLAQSEDALIAEHAHWALEHLRPV